MGFLFNNITDFLLTAEFHKGSAKFILKSAKSARKIFSTQILQIFELSDLCVKT